MSFEKMDRSTLLDVRRDTKTRIAETTLTKVETDRQAEKDNLILGYENDIREIDLALAALKSADIDKHSDTNTTLEYNRISNSVQTKINQIGSFKPDGLINEWIVQIDNLYQVRVKDNIATHPTLDQNFTTMVILALPTTAQTKFQSIKEWSKLKSNLKEFYQADISIFQHLGRLWNFNPDSTNWSDIASQMTAIMNESKNTIKQKYESKNETLTADQVFDLISAMLLSEIIRNNSSELYKMMIEKLDSCQTAADVAVKANFFKDRLDGEHLSSYKIIAERNKFKRMIQDVKSQAANKSKRNNQSQEEKDLIKRCINEKVCIRFNLGERCKGSPCPYEHRKLDDTEPKNDLKNNFISTFKTELPDWSEDLFPEGN